MLMARLGKDISVNWNGSTWGYTALHWACARGHDKIATMLLAHPSVDVNQKNKNGCTPFLYACSNGKTTCVQLLLKDARVKVNERNNIGSTPLLWAAHYGHLEVIKCWIASGREMDLGEPGNENNDAIGVATKQGRTDVVSLLERFKANPEQAGAEISEDKQRGNTGGPTDSGLRRSTRIAAQTRKPQGDE